mmetsp:Transcript_32734/g.29017  ORF Transcript_32734/g.29017 Transcript_32734/m.29017 type:complete len:312 (+) Transcript_32734:142-1077(+)
MANQDNMEIKLLSSEGWQDTQIQLLSYGGNSRLEEFLSPYLLDLEKDKYSFNVFNLKATEFYSKRLEAFAHSGYFSKLPPSLKEGTKLVENVDSLNLDYPHPSGNDDLEIDDEDSVPKKPGQEDIIDKLDNNVKEIFETTGDIFQEHASKIWDSTEGIRDKSKEAWGSANTTSKEVMDKTSEFTKESWGKTKDASKSVWDKTLTAFSSLGGDIKNFTDNGLNKTKEVVDKIKPEENLSFKSFFGLFTKEEPKEENKEKQYFDFSLNEDTSEDSKEGKKGGDDIDHLFMLKEDLKKLHEDKNDSLASESNGK